MIQFFHFQGLCPTWIKIKLNFSLKEHALLFITIKYWVAEFKRGHVSCSDGNCSGPQNVIGWPVTKSTWASRHGRHSQKCSTLYIHWIFWHEKAVCKMFVTLTLNKTKTTLWKCFSRVFDDVFTAINLSFYIWNEWNGETWSIIPHLRWRKSQNNRLKGENWLQRRQKQFHPLTRSWHFFLNVWGIIFIDYLKKGKAINGKYYAIF